MKTIQNRPGHTGSPAASRRSAEPLSIEQIRQLIAAACAARGGAALMTLNDWRDLEQEAKRRLNYEYSKISH